MSRLLLALLLCAPGCWSGCRTPTNELPPPPPTPDEALAQTTAFHQTRPVYEQPLGSGLDLPEGLASLSAEVCGACHPDIYAEWKLSTHAAAWIDEQYQVEIAKSGNRWLCLNCHTPLLVQHDRWPVGLEDGDVERPVLIDNPVHDPALREEGITCAACHLREGTIAGPGLPNSTSPHPVQADPDFRGNAICARCHQATATYPGKTFICVFDTEREWSEGPYPAEGKGCLDCHMPEVERPMALGGPVRKGRSHWWRGAGIPKVAGVQPPVYANPPGLDVAGSWGGDEVALEVTNARAGHLLPTGDPERWVQLDLRFADAAGAPVGEPWTHHIGQRWEWNPVPRKLSDNRLPPRATRALKVPVPDGAVSATLDVSSHRMTDAIAEYHHLDTYPRSVPTHRYELSPGRFEGGLLGEVTPPEGGR